MDDFVVEIDRIRRQVSPTEWRALVQNVVATHPVLELLHQEPFTRRCFQRPRGYPGDAPLLDLVYRDRPYTVELTRLGAKLHAWTDRHPGCQSVRDRLRVLARAIDRAAERREGARVLSLACGHLREAHLSNAVRRGAISELVALDQDPESLAVVEREHGASNVVASRSSVRRFVASGESLGEFDFAYTAGLFDYLEERDGIAVTAALFRSLRPGGRLLIANFAPQLPEIGYMEAVMDWWLIYRDEAAMAVFADAIPQAAIASRSIVRDAGGNIVYLTIDKA
jgi:SAM-dependent methyltransferase